MRNRTKRVYVSDDYFIKSVRLGTNKKKYIVVKTAVFSADICVAGFDTQEQAEHWLLMKRLEEQ